MLRLKETQASFWTKLDTVPSAIHAITHKGSLSLWLSSCKSLSHGTQQICPELWVRALCCSLTGCFSCPTIPPTSFCYRALCWKSLHAHTSHSGPGGPSKGPLVAYQILPQLSHSRALQEAHKQNRSRRNQ